MSHMIVQTLDLPFFVLAEVSLGSPLEAWTGSDIRQILDSNPPCIVSSRELLTSLSSFVSPICLSSLVLGLDLRVLISRSISASLALA